MSLASRVVKEEATRRGTERNGLEVGKTAAIDTRQIKPPNWKQSEPNGAERAASVGFVIMRGGVGHLKWSWGVQLMGCCDS